MTGQLVLACDVYGTFLDTSSIASALQKHLGVLESLTSSKAKEVAQGWRKYQLEYTWRLNSMGKYEPFDIVTRKSLLHAVADAGSKLSDSAVDSIMAAYFQLASFDDASPAWNNLADVESLDLWIFSNGTHEMVSSALRSASLMPTPTPKNTFLADEVQKYKPAVEIYQALSKKVGKEATPQEVYLLSSNPFDVVGARSCGLNAIWVDRSGSGWADQLGVGFGPGGRELGPTKIVRGLGEVAEYIHSISGGTK